MGDRNVKFVFASINSFSRILYCLLFILILNHFYRCKVKQTYLNKLDISRKIFFFVQIIFSPTCSRGMII